MATLREYFSAGRKGTDSSPRISPDRQENRENTTQNHW